MVKIQGGTEDQRGAVERLELAIALLQYFVLQGLLVGGAAVIDLARNAGTNVVGHQSDNLQAISAVVLGGTSLFGGIATIGGTLLGSLIPVMLANGLVILTVQVPGNAAVAVAQAGAAGAVAITLLPVQP